MQRLIDILFASSDVCKDIKLFDQFRHLVRAFFNIPGPPRRFPALLELVHPTSPTAVPYVGFLKKGIESDDAANNLKLRFEPESPKAVEGIFTKIYHTIRVSVESYEHTRKAAVSEIKAGAKVYETGRLMPNSAIHNVISIAQQLEHIRQGRK